MDPRMDPDIVYKISCHDCETTCGPDKKKTTD